MSDFPQAGRVAWSVMSRFPWTEAYAQRRTIMAGLRVAELALTAMWPEAMPPFPEKLWASRDPQELIDWCEYVGQLEVVARSYMQTGDADLARTVLGEMVVLAD